MDSRAENGSLAPGAQVAAIVRKMTERFIEKHGAELFPHGLAMQGPVHDFGDEGQPHIVEAKSRKLAARWNVEEGQDALARLGEEQAQTEIVAALVQEIHAEIKREVELLTAQGEVMIPYVLFTTAGVTIDPVTFTPTVAFLTRYGTTKLP